MAMPPMHAAAMTRVGPTQGCVTVGSIGPDSGAGVFANASVGANAMESSDGTSISVSASGAALVATVGSESLEDKNGLTTVSSFIGAAVASRSAIATSDANPAAVMMRKTVASSEN